LAKPVEANQDIQWKADVYLSFLEHGGVLQPGIATEKKKEKSHEGAMVRKPTPDLSR
jgi:hypothetical protein